MTDFDAPFNVEGMLRKLALRYVAILKVRGVGDFDDALQEARLAFLEVRDREPPQNWRMATWSRLYRSLRKRYDLKNKRYTRAMPTGEEGWQLSETVESREEPEAPEVDLARSLGVLSEKERALLIAHYVGGEKILDLAKRYGLTIRTTRQYIYVARKKITGEWRLNEEKRRQWRREAKRRSRDGTSRKLVKRTYEEQLEHIRGQYRPYKDVREYQRKRYAENREKILAKARDAYWRKKYANAEINDERKEKCD